MAKSKSSILELIMVVIMAIGAAILAAVVFLGTLLGGIGLFALLASIPALILALLWLLVGPFLATVTGIAAFGTITFWQSFGIAMIFCVLVGILAKLFRRG